MGATGATDIAGGTRMPLDLLMLLILAILAVMSLALIAGLEQL